MKKILLSLSLLALAGLAFGQEIKYSAGGSVGFLADSLYYKGEKNSQKLEFFNSSNALTVGAFVDATYAEASVFLVSGLGKTKGKTVATPGTTTEGEAEQNALFVDARLLGKYPVPFNDLTVFPLVGLEYSANIGIKDKDQYSSQAKDELNDLFLDLGAGCDVTLTEVLYLRVEALYGLNLTPTQKELKDYYSSLGVTYSDFGYRLSASVGVGYKF